VNYLTVGVHCPTLGVNYLTVGVHCPTLGVNCPTLVWNRWVRVLRMSRLILVRALGVGRSFPRETERGRHSLLRTIFRPQV
jgi:hypothetical protein